jgi:hypothetical protein
MVGEAIALAAFVGHGEAIFFPGLIEKRKHAVVKEVEKIAERPVSGAQTGEDERCVKMRKRALRASRAHEVNGERGSLTFGPIDRLDFAGGESERRI